ncbi:[LSU ribosomal protein L11P]-lysine N-methyltransferase [Tistlia consotensis]|uniref:Ribosomal protein L11 methyltransferase n=1 Tax=Tistlia consotensis USBA 355 TaxID=560819 RepID=A0A1Y6BD59_9PROT|nr:50S ribosomal protein L11 methyltransferase [Tistlia consotensis]SME97586.1 [LSU ribosomal protein L11P]-lysine N-methyltransferase [Tistlia consotensis USBA 355]SNR56929.1 [LSU ribosomal protein L11P]-lysine N-methyltransferase [Tistlia consotensis]
MSAIYRLSLKAPAAAAEILESALAALEGALATDLPDADGRVRMTWYFGDEPDRAWVTARLVAASLAAGVAAPDFELGLLPEIDWVAESQAELQPIRAGRFWVHGSHVTEPPPGGSIPLLIDANLAFGTGRHETTYGCLVALCELARRVRVGRALDLGCGSAVLALAIAKLWPAAQVLAADIDPSAVEVAAGNVRANGAPWIETLGATGYAHPRLRAAAPYDLIVANILAGPLCRLALDTARHLAPGGLVVLSGLLIRQERRVLARHRAVGLQLVARRHFNEWSVLLLQKPSAR